MIFIMGEMDRDCAVFNNKSRSTPGKRVEASVEYPNAPTDSARAPSTMKSSAKVLNPKSGETQGVSTPRHCKTIKPELFERKELKVSYRFTSLTRK